jgi:hypothetical protein
MRKDLALVVSRDQQQWIGAVGATHIHRLARSPERGDEILLDAVGCH